MSAHHNFNASDKLLKQNMVTSECSIKATEPQIMLFKKFLVQEDEQKTAAFHKARKERVDKVLSLMREEGLNQRQAERMMSLVNRLNVKVEDLPIEGTRNNTIRPQTTVQCKALDMEEQNFRIEDRRNEENGKRMEDVMQDLKALDDWLTEISKKKSKKKVPTKPPVDTRFKKPSQTVRKDKELTITNDKKLSTPLINTDVAKAALQRNQGTVRNFKSNAKTPFVPPPQKSLGVNQRNVRNVKNMDKNDIAPLCQRNDVKLTSAENKNGNKSSVRRVGSFDKDPIKKSKSYVVIPKHVPDIATLNDAEYEDTVLGRKTIEWEKEFRSRMADVLRSPQMNYSEESETQMSDVAKSLATRTRDNVIKTKISDIKSSAQMKSSKQTLLTDNHDLKTKRSDVISCPKNKSSKQKLLTDTYDVHKASSFDFQAEDEAESLSEILKLFPILEEKLNADEKVQSSEDCEGDSKVNVEEEFALYTRNNPLHRGSSVEMADCIVLGELGQSLDEILRKEESEKTTKKQVCKY